MLIEQLHLNFPSLTDMRMREIRVDRQQRKVFCTLSYPSLSSLDANIKSRLNEFVLSQIPKGYRCSVKYAEDIFDANSFTRNLHDLIKDRYPIYSHINKQHIETHISQKKIDVVLKVDAVTQRNMELSEFCDKLTEYYADYTSYTTSFSLQTDNSAQSKESVAEQEKLVQLAINKELFKPSRFFDITGQKVLFGKTIPTRPMYISDLRNPQDICTVCGKVYYKKCRQAKNNPLLQVCSFSLTDDTDSTLSCVLFVRMQITDVESIINETGRGEAEARTLAEKRKLANDKKLKDILWLSDGMSVAARGKVVYGQNGQLEMHVYDLNICKILPVSPGAEFNRAAAKEYLVIQPQNCVEYRQLNFTERIAENFSLSGKTDVVLHANIISRGKVIDDKAVAICAVKLVDGHVSERLFTYVNPEIEVADERLLRNCNLSQEKLIFYPTLTEIISDLYKFTYGCRLVGNDLPHILQLLNYYAAPMNYRFDNECVDQTELLSDLVQNSIFDGKVNAVKLDDLAKKCKVLCENQVFCNETAFTVARCVDVLVSKSK